MLGVIPALFICLCCAGCSSVGGRAGDAAGAEERPVKAEEPVLGADAAPAEDPKKDSPGGAQGRHEPAVAENPADGQAVSMAGDVNFPDFTDEFGGDDPIEGVNRSCYYINKFTLKYFFQPIIILWGSIVPRHGVECINRCTNNVAFPKRTVSAMLQAKFKYAGLDFSRFLINVTLGVAGFYDPAKAWFDIEEQDEDFGQAFAVWGIGPGPCLHIPGIGPSNVRDGIGKIFDYGLDPKSYITGGQAFTMLNEGTARYREFDTFMRANRDPYELLKRLYAAERYVKIHDLDRKAKMEEYQAMLAAEDKAPQPAPPPTPPALEDVVVSGLKSQGPSIDTLRISMFDIQNDKSSMWVDKSLWNSDFYNTGWIRSVEVVEGKPEMPYKIWYQDGDDAPLAFVIPGLGSHYSSYDATAIGEIVYDRGFTVVVLCSPMNWEFMETAATVDVPGYAPEDAEDARRAIAAIIADLKDNKGLEFKRKILLGYSLGGLHALLIGSKESKEAKIGLDRIVAVNPPVDLFYAMSRIDDYGRAWKQWPSDKVFERGVVAAKKFLNISNEKYKPFEDALPAQTAALPIGAAGNPSTIEFHPVPVSSDPQAQADSGAEAERPEKKENADEDKTPFAHCDLPFNETEAQVLIAYTFKLAMNEMALDIARTDSNPFKDVCGQCTWGNRVDFYRKVNNLTFTDFVNKYLVRYYAGKRNCDLTAEKLNSDAGLRPIGDYLRNGKNVFVLHSSNDFLESDEDRIWLKETMGERCTFFNLGGHLGNLYLKKLQERLGELADGNGK